MPRLRKPDTVIPYTYEIKCSHLKKRARIGSLPVAVRILCTASPDRAVSIHAKELWDEWIKETGFLPSPFPAGRFYPCRPHPSGICGVSVHGQGSEVVRPYPFCPLASGLTYPKARGNIGAFGQMIDLSKPPNAVKSRLSIEITAAKRLLNKPVRRVDFQVPARRKCGDPTWIPPVNFTVFGRSPGQWNRAAFEKWKSAALEELRDAHAMGEHPYPLPVTQEDIDRYFIRLPSNTVKRIHRKAPGVPSRLPCDPSLEAIRNKYRNQSAQ